MTAQLAKYCLKCKPCIVMQKDQTTFFYHESTLWSYSRIVVLFLGFIVVLFLGLFCKVRPEQLSWIFYWQSYEVVHLLQHFMCFTSTFAQFVQNLILFLSFALEQQGFHTCIFAQSAQPEWCTTHIPCHSHTTNHHPITFQLYHVSYFILGNWPTPCITH